MAKRTNAKTTCVCAALQVSAANDCGAAPRTGAKRNENPTDTTTDTGELTGKGWSHQFFDRPKGKRGSAQKNFPAR